MSSSEMHPKRERGREERVYCVCDMREREKERSESVKIMRQGWRGKSKRRINHNRREKKQKIK
jgi:hypothetical protein